MHAPGFGPFGGDGPQWSLRVAGRDERELPSPVPQRLTVPSDSSARIAVRSFDPAPAGVWMSRETIGSEATGPNTPGPAPAHSMPTQDPGKVPCVRNTLSLLVTLRTDAFVEARG